MAVERAIIGIDPGLDGALARYWPENGRLQIADMPTVKIGKGKSDKRAIDEYALAGFLDDWAETASCVWLEQVTAMPSIPGADGQRRSMGSASAFNFGKGYGLIRGVSAANFLPIHDVNSKSWKRALKVNADKEHARYRAGVLLPRHGGLWPLKKHHGRAEAALIALYGSQQAVSTIVPRAPALEPQVSA